MLSATTSPVSTLATVAETLHYMNANGIEKISHRKALMKAGRKALNVLGDS
jgi:aspartate aminotransferase-like enzyme